MANYAYRLQQDKSKSEIEEKWRELGTVLALAQLIKILDEKEAHTMQVTYNGFTGELVKLERTFAPYPYVQKYATYDLTITVLKEGVCADVHFTGVKLEDVKFLSGEVTFGG